MRFRRSSRAPSTTLAAIALLCMLAGCGTTSTPSPTNPPTTSGAPATSAVPTTSGEPTSATTPAACADAAALKSSLEALTKIRPTQDGVGALTTAIATVKSNLDAAQASASSSPELQSSVQQVKTAFDELQTAASGLTTDNVAQKAPAIVSAMKQVQTATKELSSTVTQGCPGS